MCCPLVVAIPFGPAGAQVPTINLSTCVPPNGRYPQLKFAIVFGTNGAIATGCSPLPLRVSGDGFTGFWNNGTESTFNLAVNTDLGSMEPLGFIADVTTGTIAGSQATAVPIIAQNGLCGLGGVRSLSAIGVVVFTQ